MKFKNIILEEDENQAVNDFLTLMKIKNHTVMTGMIVIILKKIGTTVTYFHMLLHLNKLKKLKKL